jgi:large subunit ribosomal protein L29
MKPMKARELRQKTLIELQNALDEQKSELYKLSVQKTLMQLKDTGAFKITRKNIARINTLIAEKQQ